MKSQVPINSPIQEYSGTIARNYKQEIRGINL